MSDCPPQDRPKDSPRAVQHAMGGVGGHESAPGTEARHCASCGAQIPCGRSGRLRKTASYCSRACRFRATRARRAMARAELALAVAALKNAAEKTEAALRVLGLLPVHGRRRNRHDT